jgi:hypothetical protein
LVKALVKNEKPIAILGDDVFPEGSGQVMDLSGHESFKTLKRALAKNQRLA